MMTAALALLLVSCNGNKDYKAEGQELSKQLDEVVEKNDTAAALTTDESIREMEQEIVALGDSAALADFRAAMKDSRIRNAAFVTVGKIRNGMDKNEALNELVQDALDENIDVNAITAAVNAILAAEMKQNTKKAEK